MYLCVLRPYACVCVSVFVCWSVTVSMSVCGLSPVSVHRANARESVQKHFLNNNSNKIKGSMQIVRVAI